MLIFKITHRDSNGPQITHTEAYNINVKIKAYKKSLAQDFNIFWMCLTLGIEIHGVPSYGYELFTNVFSAGVFSIKSEKETIFNFSLCPRNLYFLLPS